MIDIIPFEQKYRDDTIFCLLSAKDALGQIPRLNEDILDIHKYYFDKGDMFWIALDNGRVVGTIGINTISSTDLWLKRLFVKPAFKRKGIGSLLLETAEKHAVSKNILTIHTRFPDDFYEASHFYPSKGFVEYEKTDEIRHLTKKIDIYNGGAV